MEIRRRRTDFLARETDNLFVDQLQIGNQFFWRSVLVRPRWRIGVRVKGDLQPTGVVLPFGLVTIGKLPQRKPICRREVDVQDELGFVFCVKATEHLEIETVE